MTQPITLHEYAPSGNCYKIRLTAALLGTPLERRESCAAYSLIRNR